MFGATGWSRLELDQDQIILSIQRLCKYEYASELAHKLVPCGKGRDWMCGQLTKSS
jgi:hypothetical protein